MYMDSRKMPATIEQAPTGTPHLHVLTPPTSMFDDTKSDQ